MPRRSRPTFTTFAGTVFRGTTYDEPLWVNPNRRDGRWNIANHGSTQYCCLDSEAPYAEMLRGEDLRNEHEASMYKTILWQLRFEEGAVVDYSTFDRAEAAGFPADALVEDDHERCQSEAALLQSLGARGLLSPSAALPGSVNLTIFGPRAPARWDTTARLASMVPVQRLSEGGAPRGLVKRVRYFGMPHAGLIEHQAAQRRLFDPGAAPPPRRSRDDPT